MGNLDIIKQLDIFAVEHIKDTRRYFVKLGLKEKIDQSRFIEINKHSTDQSNQQVLEVLEQGASVGIISDAGCPAIADPGSDLCLPSPYKRYRSITTYRTLIYFLSTHVKWF